MNHTGTLCVKCGHRGFTKIQKPYDSVHITALECNNCKSIIYPHESMVIIQTNKE
jgi:hypothetical protein